MQRFSIVRSLRLALLGLTVVLAAVAALGVAGLYSVRERYDDTLEQSSALATRLLRSQIAAETAAQALAEQKNVPAASGAGGPLARAQALGARLQTRQQARQSVARASARSDSRRAVLLVAVAGVLALIGALALITALVSSMRRPLDQLVDATRALADGQLARRVVPCGPRELRDLGGAFNAMGEDLASTQRRVEEERRRLAVTIESLGDALIVTEPGSARIATVNPRAAELVPELAVGACVDSNASPLPPLDGALGRETLVEHRGRALAVTAALLGSEADGVVWTVRDMSGHTRLEQAKSDFVATASHELRSPLTSIKGFVELLERSPENMSARQREFVDIILRSTDRLVDLVNDLLDVARIEADRVEIDLRPIDIGEAVQEVVELMGPQIAQKHQQLEVHVAPRLPLALADSGRVRQIIANLMTNAHQYTEDGGRIHVRVEPDRAWIQLVVADHGSGMSEDETERIFERFYRIRDGGRPSAGTGLGLSIVKSLVDLHHGQIDVDSVPGRGTTFRVLLPAASVGLGPERLRGVVRGRRVLVVDDEPEIAALIAGQLAPLEVQSTIASSGEEALALLRTEHFDAVTLDILMPGMDGFSVLREIRGDTELSATPIVFVSVFSGRHELAGEWVVSKPIDADELRGVLSAAVRAGRSRVLVVGREQMQPMLEPALDDLGIEHEWELSGAAAARVCGERRFELALVDVGVRNPHAVLQALDLRGRRLPRAVILFSDESTPMPRGIGKLGIAVVPVDQAAAALLSALRGERQR